MSVEPPEAATLSCFKPFDQVEGRRIALMVAHAPNGRVKPNVPVYCAALCRAEIKIVLIVASDQPLALDASLTEMLTGGYVRDNKGYDFAAWAHVLKLKPELWSAKILYLLNDSVIGPLSQERLDNMLHRVAENPADVVAATESREIEWHLQSYFLALKRKALASKCLHDFFDNVRNLPDKGAVIRTYEVPLARLLTAGGLDCAGAYRCRDNQNQTISHWRALIHEGFPFLKTEVLRGSLPQRDTAGWRETLAAAGFDPSIASATVAANQIVSGVESRDETGGFALSPRRDAILVLGMHRSGTSAAAGVMSKLGVAEPKTLLSPQNDNPRGFFESAPLVAAHDELLASAGSHWHDWRKIDPQWNCSEAAEQHRRKVKAVLLDEFDNKTLIVIKDPRICRFVPFVSSILAELKFSPVAVLMVRNPVEVAHSLRRRESFALSKSILMWLRHVLDAEYYSRSMPRCFLPYEGLLLDWRHHIDRVAEQTGIVWPSHSSRSGAEIDEFLTTELHHERAAWDETKDDPEVSELARRTYRILLEICSQGEKKEMLDELDAVRMKFDEECHTSGER